MSRTRTACAFALSVLIALAIPSTALSQGKGNLRREVRQLDRQVDGLKQKNADLRENVTQLEEQLSEVPEDESNNGLENNEWALTALVIGIIVAVLRIVGYGATASILVEDQSAVDSS